MGERCLAPEGRASRLVEQEVEEASLAHRETEVSLCARFNAARRRRGVVYPLKGSERRRFVL